MRWQEHTTEDEVDVIRTIFDRYIHTNDGVSGVAKYLNQQGFVKKLRQNGTIPGFSASFVKSIIDNPVYMGKIAYGRRRTEKKIGTRNEMHVVDIEDCCGDCWREASSASACMFSSFFIDGSRTKSA